MVLHSQIIGTGTPFVILHGFLGMSDNWKSLGKNLPLKDTKCTLLISEITEEVFMILFLVIRLWLQDLYVL